MRNILVLVLLASSFTLVAQQLSPQASGALTAPQVLSTVAGMRADLDQATAENRRLALRCESLEEQLAAQAKTIAELQNLCTALNGQLKALDQQWNSRLAEIQKAINANQKLQQEELQRFMRDVTDAIGKLNTPPPPAPRTSIPPAPAATPATPLPEGKYIEFKVASGDTLSSIAKAAGTTVAAIKKANGLTSDVIRAGQVLKIPQK